MHICSVVVKKLSNGYVKFLNHCKPMKKCPFKMNSLAFTFAACVLLCNKGRISIEINKLRGHIIHSNLTRLLLSYFCISSLTNVSLMRPTEWTSHLLNWVQKKVPHLCLDYFSFVLRLVARISKVSRYQKVSVHYIAALGPGAKSELWNWMSAKKRLVWPRIFTFPLAAIKSNESNLNSQTFSFQGGEACWSLCVEKCENCQV